MTAVKMRSSNAATRAQPVLVKIQHGPSSHDLVSHATVGYRADLLFGVKVIRESGIDLARLVECLYLFRRERQVEARQIVLQLRNLSRANNRDDRHRAIAKPCQRDSRHAAAGLTRYRFDGRPSSPLKISSAANIAAKLIRSRGPAERFRCYLVYLNNRESKEWSMTTNDLLDQKTAP